MLVDGLPLDPAVLTGLRRATASADPAVHLWNRSLFDNLAYGHLDPTLERIGMAIALADLGAVAARLPEGLDTPLGESGGLICRRGPALRFGRALSGRRRGWWFSTRRYGVSIGRGAAIDRRRTPTGRRPP